MHSRVASLPAGRTECIYDRYKSKYGDALGARSGARSLNHSLVSRATCTPLIYLKMADNCTARVQPLVFDASPRVLRRLRGRGQAGALVPRLTRISSRNNRRCRLDRSVERNYASSATSLRLRRCSTRAGRRKYGTPRMAARSRNSR